MYLMGCLWGFILGVGGRGVRLGVTLLEYLFRVVSDFEFAC